MERPEERLSIRTLGGFELRQGDRVLIDAAWNRSKAKAMLKLLATQRSRSMHRERVMDELWPNLDVEAAANQFNKNLHFLKRALADGGVADATLLSLADNMLGLGEDVWLDIDAFRHAAATARSTRLASFYEEALALYRGDLLPEDLYESWTEPLREELRSLRTHLLIEVAELYETSAALHAAEQRLLMVLESDALNEEAHRRLMQLYVKGGNRDRALRQFQKMREALHEQLGVDVSPESETLYREILRENPRGREASIHPEVRYAVAADGVRIAYCVEGSGPAIVFARGWISHLELLWDDERLRGFWQTLARDATLVRFDMRGNGLSQRHRLPPIDVDAMALDIAAVVDELGLRDIVLYGASFGGPAAIAYAARHGDRVERLVLDGTYARGEGITSDNLKGRLLEALRGTPEAGFMALSYLTQPRDKQDAQYRRLDHTPRMISPAVAAELYEMAFATDVLELAAQVTCPTLVMHRAQSQAIPVALGRELAEVIPGARFVELPGTAHNSWEGDPAPALEALLQFLGESAEEAAS